MKVCEKCGCKLELEFPSCYECGEITVKEYSVCTKCDHIITVSKAKFCPYCQQRLVEVKEIVDVTEIETIEATDIKVTREILWSNIKFNFDDTKKLVSSTSFPKTAVAYTMIAGLTAGITFLLLLVLFPTGGDGTFIDAIKVFIMITLVQPVILFSIAYFFNYGLNNLRSPADYSRSLNLIGSYAPVFFIKDIFGILSLLYIYIFARESEGYELGMIIYITLTVIVFLFILLHLSVYLHNIVRTNYLLSFGINVTNYALATLCGVYFGYLLYMIIEMIL